ncbi:MAG TPA: hypothetical protein VNI61_09040, partial [Gemmatimonadales bacterium]|nr:hypothetical protein [Gemmatimonadales bacterium]
AEAWHALERRLLAWEQELLPWVDQRQTAIARQFTDEARRLLDAVAEAAADALGAQPAPDPPSPRFAPSAEYYFAPDPETAAMDLTPALEGLLATLLPEGTYRVRLQRRLSAQLADWARRNATRVTSEIWLAAADARRTFEGEIAAAVRGLADLARHALDSARERRAAGHAAVGAAVARVDRLLNACRRLEAVLQVEAGGFGAPSLTGA